MTNIKPSNKIATLWFVQSIIVTSIIAYVILQNLNLPGPKASSFLGITYSLLLGLAITGTFLMIFHNGLSNSEKNIFKNPSYQLPSLFLAQAVLFLSYLNDHMSITVFFMATTMLQTLSTFFVYGMVFKNFKIPDAQARKIRFFATALIPSLAIISWQFKNFSSTEFVMVLSSGIFAATNCLPLIAVGLWYTLHPQYRIDPKSAANSFYLRTKAPDNRRNKTFVTTAIAGLSQLVFLVLITQNFSSFVGGEFYLGVVTFQFLFIPAVIDAWLEVSMLGVDVVRLRDLSNLTTKSAKRFMLRHNQKRQLWSAAVGVKTAFLQIEHDAEGVLKNKLPANFLRIRSEEVSHLVEAIMPDRLIIASSSPDVLAVSLDSETSLRPCLDALKLCTTLYLDAGLILQRRLQGLIALLPIVNPGLASAVDKDSAVSLLRKTNWFFFFDYLWIDEKIVNTPKNSKYGVQYDQLSPEVRLNLISYMRNIHGLGNFIWFSSQAQQRLIQELPTLSQILTPHEIIIENSSPILMFSVKFEELIPRLQRYYALDQQRECIVDFEPSQDSQKLLNILSLQINNASKSSELARIIDVLSSFNWRGFKEKDLALRLLLSINERLQNFSKLESTSSDTHKDIFAKLGEAVSAIGYPSQITNQAHLYKVELRNLERLKVSALNPQHLSFAEAWTTLASIDYRRFSDDEFSALKLIIRSAVKRSDIMLSPTIQGRVLECVSNLIMVQAQSGQALDRELLITVIGSIIALKANFETASLLIDTMTFTSKMMGEPIDLPDKIFEYFENLSKQKTDHVSYWQQSVINSWLEFKTTQQRDCQKEHLRAS